MSGESTDPRRIRSLAVHRDDVLTAFEARERGSDPAVLRVVAPFSGRMRARIHVADTDPGAAELHIQPSAFVDEPPSFPRVDATEDRLRERGAYDIDRHREAHERAVARWRDTVEERLRERISLPIDGDDAERHDVSVSYLG